MPLLEVREFAKQFTIHHLARQVPAFDRLSFTLEAGQFLLVRGPNGVGKSTLLRCLYRSYRPTHGSALYASNHGPVDLATAADVDIALLRREEIGFVTQFLRARPRVNALEMVAEPLLAAPAASIADTDAMSAAGSCDPQVAHRFQGAETLQAAESFQRAKEEAARLLDIFGLKPALWSAYPTTFSGGEQQKVNLARALIRPRRLLLLDEPTASLDKETRAALAVRLGELKQAGVAMIGVLHHPEDVQGLVDDELHLTLPASAAPEVSTTSTPQATNSPQDTNPSEVYDVV